MSRFEISYFFVLRGAAPSKRIRNKIKIAIMLFQKCIIYFFAGRGGGPTDETRWCTVPDEMGYALGQSSIGRNQEVVIVTGGPNRNKAALIVSKRSQS